MTEHEYEQVIDNLEEQLSVMKADLMEMARTVNESWETTYDAGLETVVACIFCGKEQFQDRENHANSCIINLARRYLADE